MGWTPTLTLLALSLGLGVVAELRARRPPDLSRPSLIPWRVVVLCCGLAALVLLGHVVGLLGIQPPPLRR